MTRNLRENALIIIGYETYARELFGNSEIPLIDLIYPNARTGLT